MSSDMESSSAIVARSRLAILAAHLSAAATLEPSEMASSLVAHCVSARTTVPPPEMLKGSLTVVDERTGKRYQIQISEHGTIKANDLKKVHQLNRFIHLDVFDDVLVVFLSILKSSWC